GARVDVGVRDRGEGQGGRDDVHGDARAAGGAVEVRDGGGERVRTGRERRAEGRRAGAEDAVAARGPADGRAQVPVLRVEGGGGEGDVRAREDARARRRRGDRDHGGRRRDRHLDLRRGGRAVGVGDGRGEHVAPLGEEEGAGGAREERAVAVGRPTDPAADVAVEVVGGGRGELHRRARGRGGAVVRRGDAELGRRVRAAHADRDRGLAGEAVRVRDRGGDRVPADGEAVGADGRPGAERASHVGAPLHAGAQVAVLHVGRLPREADGEVGQVVDGALGRGRDPHHRGVCHDDGDVRLG